MSARLAAILRLDPARPRPGNLDVDPLGGSVVLHADDDLVLLGARDAAPAVAATDGVVACAWGRPTGCVDALPDGLRADDPRALLHLYAERGDDFARRLDGHFVVLIRDIPRGRLLLQDRFPGIATAYRLERDGYLYLSDRIEPLLRLNPDARARLDDRALHHFLADTYTTAPDTIYADVKQLGCGERLVVEEGRARVEIYDGWTRADEKITDPEAAFADYRAKLGDAVGDWIEYDPACGFLLSGGLDSSALVALAAERSERPLPTFGIASTDFHTDAPYARRVAERYGTDHSERLVEGGEIEDLPRLVHALEQPFYEPGMMLSWCALSLAGESVKTVVGGEIADQLFGASVVPVRQRVAARRRFGPLLEPALALIRGLARSSPARGNVFARKVENRLVGPQDPAHWCGHYGFRDCDLAGLLRRPLPEDDRYPLTGLPHDDLESMYDFGCTVLNRDYANHGILQINGRLGDLLGLETFSPFCSRAVADHILALDTSLRFHASPDEPEDFTYKALHRRLAYELLEADIVDRPKQGGAINPLIHLLDETRLDRVRRGVLRSPYLDDLCRREPLAALFNDVPANATRILQLVTLDLWHAIFHELGGEAAPDFTLSQFLEARAG